MSAAKDVMETIYDKLDNFLKTETVIGETIDLGEVKLVPIITASFGLGGGVDEEENESVTGGGGLGCKISPDAILVVRGSEVEMMPVKNRDALDKLIEQIPEIINRIDSSISEKLKNRKDDKKKEEKEEEEEEKKEKKKKKEKKSKKDKE